MYALNGIKFQLWIPTVWEERKTAVKIVEAWLSEWASGKEKQGYRVISRDNDPLFVPFVVVLLPGAGISSIASPWSIKIEFQQSLFWGQPAAMARMLRDAQNNVPSCDWLAGACRKLAVTSFGVKRVKAESRWWKLMERGLFVYFGNKYIVAGFSSE